MDHQPLGELIASSIVDTVRSVRTRTRYCQPLVSFVAATDSRFARLREVVDPDHALPADILPGARSVVSFFLPFAAEVVTANRRHALVAEEWAVAYEETNRLIATACGTVADRLASLGVRAAWELPTYKFDREKLVARWSHKSVAYIAGLGQFGRHQMLITPAGCAGRFGSIVVDADLSVPTERRGQAVLPCDQGCRVCLDRCPVGALSETGLDKQRCYERCRETDSFYRDRLGGIHDVCGKCATGPCAGQNSLR